MRIIPFGCALILWLGGMAAPVRGADRDVHNWIDGPIRYIATKEEMETFRSLKSDRDRVGFVHAFWSRRDPTPETLINEYRQLFWERVQEANRLFIDSPKPGWKTDRGKVYILYGPPTRIEDDPHAETDGLPAAGRGLIRWSYEGGPPGRQDMNPVLVIVPFVRDASGEYRVSHDPKLASEFYTWDDIETRSFYEKWLETDIIEPSRSPLAVMLDMGRMQEVPPQEELILDRVETFEFFGHDPLDLEIHRYRDPGGAGSLVSLTVAPPSAPSDARPAIIARLLPRDADDPSHLLGEASFRFDGEGESLRAQARIVMSPGTYDLTILAVLPGTTASSFHKGVVTIPDESDEGIRLSDVALAARLEPLEYDSLASYEEPFIVGTFRMVPLVGQRLGRGGDLNLFYEIYGGRRPYRVTYRIEGLQPDGSWAPMSRPIVQEGGEGAQGWSTPTTDAWPLGRYRVAIEVVDADGLSQSSHVPFELVAPEPS